MCWWCFGVMSVDYSLWLTSRGTLHRLVWGFISRVQCCCCPHVPKLPPRSQLSFQREAESWEETGGCVTQLFLTSITYVSNHAAESVRCFTSRVDTHLACLRCSHWPLRLSALIWLAGEDRWYSTCSSVKVGSHYISSRHHWIGFIFYHLSSNFGLFCFPAVACSAWSYLWFALQIRIIIIIMIVVIIIIQVFA